MSILEQALVTWRRTRRNVSEHRETNIAAWLVELQQVLAEYGLDETRLCPDDSLRAFVEKEYVAWEQKNGRRLKRNPKSVERFSDKLRDKTKGWSLIVLQGSAIRL